MRVFRVWLAIALALGGSGCAQKVASIDVSPKRIKVYGIGSTQRITARILDKKSRPIEQGSVSWSSSKPDVASVDDSGRVTAKGPGRTMIVARFEKVEAQVPIEVVDIKTIEVTPPNLLLVGPPGIRFPLDALAKSSTGKPAEASSQWSSSRPSVATVDAHGVVSTVGPGTTTIVARLGELQAGCDVIVSVRDVVRLQLRPATAILRVGDVQRFEVLGFGPDGKAIEGMSTVFQSSDRAVARVDAAGDATGVAPGTATIRATLGPLIAEATLLVN